MASNTARQLVAPELIPNQQPTIHTAPNEQPNRKVALSAMEKTTLAIIGIAFFGMLVGLLTTKIAVVNAQRDLQTTSRSMTQVHARNSDLKQEIGELTSSDRLDAFAQKNGLTLNENNIRNVSKWS